MFARLIFATLLGDENWTHTNIERKCKIENEQWSRPYPYISIEHVGKIFPRLIFTTGEKFLTSKISQSTVSLMLVMKS